MNASVTHRYVYLHGFASGPQSRKAQAFRDALAAEGVPLEIPDLTAGDFEHLTVSGQLKVIEDTLHNAPGRLIGSSMGGYLAALYASQHPEVDRLALLAPAFGFAEHWRHSDAGKHAAWRKSGRLDVYHYSEKRMRRVHYGLLEDALQHPAFPKVECPALIFHGVADSVVPVRLARQWSAAQPLAQLDELQANHELLDVLDHITAAAMTFLLR